MSKQNRSVSSKESSKLLSTAFASIVAAGTLSTQITTAQAAVPDQPKEWEKCAGVVKAGKNDCGSTDGRHGCAGQSTADLADTEWVYVPKGTCAKLVGGNVYAVKPAKE